MPKLSFDAIDKKLAELNKLKLKLENSKKNARLKNIPKVFALMKKLNLSVEDLAGAAAPKKGTPGRKVGATGAKKAKRAGGGSSGEPRYRNTETGETWIGKGRPPAWITVQEKAGRDRKEFLIQKAPAAEPAA
jgi:DNA-binding protein H-NS